MKGKVEQTFTPYGTIKFYAYELGKDTIGRDSWYYIPLVRVGTVEKTGRKNWFLKGSSWDYERTEVK